MNITPLHTRIDAIMNVPILNTPRLCRSFCGMVNYISMFCLKLQELLKPIHDLTRKGQKFLWTDNHTKIFEEIKNQLCKPPVLRLPTADGRFILYSDTSRSHAGSALWQIQNGIPCLIGYASKMLQKACLCYSVTELEMYGLLLNLHSWNHLIQKVDFDCAIDHLACVHIMNGKKELANNRIETLLGRLLDYTF